MQSEVVVEQAVAYEDECLEVLASAEFATARVGSSVSGMALVVRAEVRQDRAGRDYAALTLRGKGGRLIDGRWWQFPLGAAGCPAEGSVWWFGGAVDLFNGCRQMRIIDGHTLEGIDLGLFARSSRRTLNELGAELEEVISLLDAGMAAIVREALASPVWERFSVWPAAQTRHGAVRHGLLAHSVRVAQIARLLPRAYPDGLAHDENLTIAAAMLHDVGKTRTLPALAGGALPQEAIHFDHVTIGVMMVRSAAERAEPRLAPERLDSLLHAILAHHGRREWGAPCEPANVEASLVHLADLAESQLWGWSGEEE